MDFDILTGPFHKNINVHIQPELSGYQRRCTPTLIEFENSFDSIHRDILLKTRVPGADPGFGARDGVQSASRSKRYPVNENPVF